jgi:hypothetical protein
MNRLIILAAVVPFAFAAAAPTWAQGRFGNEAKQRAADREEREAIRKAEHPELYEKPKPAEAPAQEAAAPVQAAAEPAAAPAAAQ